MPSARVVYEQLASAVERRDDAAITALIHPRARWQTLASEGRQLQGRSEILDAVRSWRTRMYQPTVQSVEEAGDDALLVVGRLRHETDGGFADVPVVWLTEVRDGMFWRVRLFSSEGEARAALRRQGVETPAGHGAGGRRRPR